MPDGLPAGALTSLEDLLGPSEGRYFAAGYRGVVHSLAPAAGDADPDAAALTTTATVSYPRDWSTDGAGRPRTPHLSSVDAVVLATLAFERAAGAGATHRWIRDVELHAGTEPWWDLENVPVSVGVETTADGTRLRGKVGNIRTVVQLCDSPRPDDHAPPVEPPPDAAPSVYGDAFRRTTATTGVHPVDRVTQSVRAEHRFAVDDDPPAPASASGVEAAYHPALTVLDYLVTMGQLTQVLVYELAGTGRAAVGNLWMRSLRILGVPRPEPLPAALTTTTTLVRDRLLTRAGAAVHDVLVESKTSNGVRAEGKLAWGGAA
ncbi:AvrD family protein [Luteimicrobium sp. NPDC057192]|uniref:AvrD family protein n=1 Tax=Luteimicrobium sp. NPDC057192 TaxID=3346042 RepID=UPI003628D5BF